MTPNPALVDRLMAWLQTSHAMKRPPTTAAGVLALIVELHARNAPFPTRAEVAETLRCSVFGVDSAPNQAIARGYIEQKVSVTEGNVQRRESVVRHRYYIPSDELLSAAGASTGRAA